MRGTLQEYMSRNPESDIQAAICDYLSAKRIFFWRCNNIPAFHRENDGRTVMHRIGKFTRKGIPDILAVHGAKFYAIEVKTKTGKLTPDQAIFGRDVQRAGGEFVVARSIDDVIKAGL
jgi:hypothetical protein